MSFLRQYHLLQQPPIVFSEGRSFLNTHLVGEHRLSGQLLHMMLNTEYLMTSEVKEKICGQDLCSQAMSLLHATPGGAYCEDPGSVCTLKHTLMYLGV